MYLKFLKKMEIVNGTPRPPQMSISCRIRITQIQNTQIRVKYKG